MIHPAGTKEPKEFPHDASCWARGTKGASPMMHPAGIENRKHRLWAVLRPAMLSHEDCGGGGSHRLPSNLTSTMKYYCVCSAN